MYTPNSRVLVLMCNQIARHAEEIGDVQRENDRLRGEMARVHSAGTPRAFEHCAMCCAV